MLKLKLQYCGHLMCRTDSFEKILMLGKIESRMRRGWPRMRWLDGIINTMVMGFSRLQELVMNREAWVLQFLGSQRVGQDWATELNWKKKKNRSFTKCENFPFKSSNFLVPWGWVSRSYVHICSKYNTDFLVFLPLVYLVTQLCLSLWDSVGCSPPGSSVHGILQARILEWVSITFSRESSQPRDQTFVSSIAGKFFTN